MKIRCRILAGAAFIFCCTTFAAEPPSLPDTQTPEFTTLLTRYNAALTSAQEKHKASMTQLINRYLDEAGEMLKEKRKARNTTGIAIATTASSIFETALSNLNTSGTFEVPTKVRRELEATVSEFNTGRTLIDTALTNEKTKLFKQYSDEFAAQVLRVAPALAGPESRGIIDERFKAMGVATTAPARIPEPGKPETSTPADPGTNTSATVTNLVVAESGPSPSWIPVGTLTTYIRSMEVLEIPLRELQLGTNLFKQYSAISDFTMEIFFVASKTNFTSPTCLYRLVRIPNFNEVSLMDWPSPSNGYRLNLRTPSPERIPYAIGFELQISALPQAVIPKPPVTRKITLSVRSTPPKATIQIDGVTQQDTVTPCTLQLPVGPHDFRLSLAGYQDLNVTNYNFTVNRDINWTFKPLPSAKPKR